MLQPEQLGELTELLSHMNVILDKEQAEALLIDWSDGAPVLFEDGTKELSRVAFLRSVRGPKGKKLIHRAERTKLISWTQNFKNISKAFASVGELMFAVHAPVSQTAFEWFWFVSTRRTSIENHTLPFEAEKYYLQLQAIHGIYRMPWSSSGFDGEGPVFHQFGIVFALF